MVSRRFLTKLLHVSLAEGEVMTVLRYFRDEQQDYFSMGPKIKKMIWTGSRAIKTYGIMLFFLLWYC